MKLPTGQFFRHIVTCCPNCFQPLDTSRDLDVENPRKPEPKDITMCGYCNVLLIYKDDLKLRLASDQDDLEEAIILLQGNGSTPFIFKE